MRYDNEEWYKIWKGIDLPVRNWDEKFSKSWPEHSKISKACTLMGCLWPKYILLELKKYRGVMFDWAQYLYKLWRKTDLCFQKWHEEFGKFSPEHLKISKLGPWWHPLVYILKYTSLKIAGELCVKAMKNEAKIKDELTCQFKTDMRNLTIFDPNTRKFKVSTLMSCFWPNYIMFELKKYREVICDSTEDWCKTWRLKNSDFILESKMAELNQSKNLKQPDRPDAVWKLYFNLEINE